MTASAIRQSEFKIEAKDRGFACLLAEPPVDQLARDPKLILIIQRDGLGMPPKSVGSSTSHPASPCVSARTFLPRAQKLQSERPIP